MKVKSGVKRIKIKGIETSYYCKGKGIPLVVMPGWRTDIERGEEMLNCFATRYKVYYVNLPGYGNSKYNKAYTFEESVEFVKKWVKRLKLNKFILMGLSMGGPFAYEMAKDKDISKMISKIILFAPWYDSSCVNVSRFYKACILSTVYLGSREIMSKLGQRVYENKRMMKWFVRKITPGVEDDENLDKYVHNFANFSFRATSVTLMNLYKLNLRTEKEKIDIPAMFIMSKKDNRVDFFKTLKGYKEMFSNLKIKTLDFKFHAPSTWITKELIEDNFTDVIKEI